MKFLALFVVFVLKQEVLSETNTTSEPGNSTALAAKTKIINTKITHFKDFTYDNYHIYLSDLLRMDVIPVGLELQFPKSLSSSNYTLTDGVVSRFYEPTGLYGSFDRIIFHRLNKEFFGITQVYGPKVEFSFKYTTNFQGSEKTGSVHLVVSHSPVELQIDLGDLEDGSCVVDNTENDVFYFYDDQLTLIPNFDPDSDVDAGKDLIKQISETWLGELYKIIMKVKVDKIASDTKQKIMNDSEFRKNLDHICKS